MKLSLIITAGMLTTAVAYNAYALTCGAQPSCDSLGYTYTGSTSDCLNTPMKCPFNSSYFNCVKKLISLTIVFLIFPKEKRSLWVLHIQSQKMDGFKRDQQELKAEQIINPFGISMAKQSEPFSGKTMKIQHSILLSRVTELCTTAKQCIIISLFTLTEKLTLINKKAG